MKTRGGLWRGQDMTRDGKGAIRGFRQAFRRIYRSSFCAHNANLEGTQRLRHDRARCGIPCRTMAGKQGPVARALRYNPFVLVNYSSTICLNPPADHGRFKSWPVSTGREKRCDGGPAKFQGAAQVSTEVSAVRGNPADG